MTFIKDSRKRRSDRLMVSIPVRVSGVTETGEAFERSGHAVDVNRFGAYIQMEKPVQASPKILLTNLENNLSGEFRVVKVLESSPAGNTALGVEALGNYPTFWGIDFPARPMKPSESRGLLECLKCRSATLHPLMLDEIEVLESGGSVKKPCTSCGSKTEWKFAMEGARGTLPERDPAAPDEDKTAAEQQPGKRTVYMQRPVSVRTASGEIETVQTEDLSNNEFRCASKKSYEVNQVVTLEWESSGTGRRIQTQGRIRRRQSVAGSPRVIYSIRYEGQSAVLPPAPLKSIRKLYAAMAVLVAAASVLLVINVRGLVFSLTVPSGSVARRVAYLGAILLLVSLAHKVWKTILAREPENRQMLRKRHRAIAWLVAIVFLGSLGMGALYGVASGYQRQQTLKVLNDLAMARIFESNIDSAENRLMDSPENYADVCATLALLAGKWQTHLDALSADALELYRTQLWQSAKSREGMKALEEVLALDRRKLRVVEEQIALRAEAKNLSPDQQQAFWQSNFPPLRQKIGDLDREKDRVVKTLIAEK
ncbi:MAG: hypothetical protein WB819_10070 [Terriglobia bacterium]